MKVEDFMTRQVIAVTPDTSVLAAAKLMLEHKISGLPVVDAMGRVVGVVSEHDLLRRRERDEGAERPHWLELIAERAGLAEEAARFHDRKVGEVMTGDPATVTADSSLDKACRLINDRGVKRLPVVEDGELVGIIARADLVRALAQSMEAVAATTARDVSVDARLTELERQIWRSRTRSARPF